MVESILMAILGRRDLILLLLGVSSGNKISLGINGITRLQKFLFLLEREQNIILRQDGFEFSPYKAGPYSSKIYDDLEVLENLGLIETELTSEVADEEAVEIDMLSFEDLMGDDSEDSEGKHYDSLGAADAYEERRFRLTREGKRKVKELLESKAYEPVVEGIRKVKSRYSNYSLSDLLYYIYTKYPDMTTESEIKKQVLRKRRRQ
jgi:uncharacterized protein YwgA